MRYKLKRLFILIFLFINTLHAHYVTCNMKFQLGNQLFAIATTVAYAIDNNLTPIFPGIERALGGAENYKNIFPNLDTTEIKTKYYQVSETKQHVYTPLKFVENRDICLSGYFQSEKYFIHHQDVIRKLFAPSEDIKFSIMNNWKEVLKKNCIALHVRTFHTDKKSWHPQNRLKGGIDYLIDYFKRATEEFPEDAQFLVFSDDISWCKKNLIQPKSTKFIFVENNPRHIDFYLMSFCKHQIISPDSSFSWWAAWLNDNPEKIVIAPNVNFSKDDLDFIPDTWKKI